MRYLTEHPSAKDAICRSLIAALRREERLISSKLENSLRESPSAASRLLMSMTNPVSNSAHHIDCSARRANTEHTRWTRRTNKQERSGCRLLSKPKLFISLRRSGSAMERFYFHFSSIFDASACSMSSAHQCRPCGQVDVTCCQGEKSHPA